MEPRRVRFVHYMDSAGRYRWHLKARNGKIVADSGQGYTRKEDRDKAVRDMILDIQCRAYFLEWKD